MKATPRLPGSAALAGILVAGLLLRLAFLARVGMSGDEAVFGLMSFAIARGEDYPLYCWGAHYASALISYLGIVSMGLLGPTSFGFKAATLLWNIGTLVLVPRALSRDWGTGRAAAAGALLAVVPAPFLEMTLAAHGGYPETFFIGPAIWVVALDLADPGARIPIGRRAAALLLGFLAGASFAILWLGVPFLVAALALLVARRALDRSELVAASIGALIGSLPFWIYNLWLSPAATIRRLGGRSLAAGAETPLTAALAGRLVDLPRWIAESAEGLAVLFAPLGGLPGLILVLLASGFSLRAMRRDPDARRRNWALLITVFAAAFLLFNLAGNLVRPRHWTPLWLVLPIALAGLGRRRATLVLAALALVTLPHTIAFIRSTTPFPVIHDAAARIASRGADALIADYDIGYPVAFELQGRIPTAAVAAPSPSDRRPSWTRAVDESLRPAALLVREDADRILPGLVATGYPFELHDLGSRVLVIISGSRSAVAPESASAPAPGRWLLARVLHPALDSTVADPGTRP